MQQSRCTGHEKEAPTVRRWLMLFLATTAQTATCAFLYGIPYLADELRTAWHLSLPQVGLLVAAPTLGLLVSLVAWGAAADRYGERVVIASGLGLSALFLLSAQAVHGVAALGAVFALAGAAGASVSSAGGRLVMGWFGSAERGLAMGIRQTATPLGMGTAALTLPPIAGRWGLHGALAFLAVLAGVTAVLVAVLAADPAGTTAGSSARRRGNPYRGTALWRIHGAGALLVLPQFTTGAFALVLLVDLRGWSAVEAGRILACAQVLGALLRIAAGRWSDRVGSRMRPMRQLALFTSLVVAAGAAGAAFPSPLTDVLLVLAVGVTASTNGLSFTATAETAGPAWSGRALGVHNTGQNLSASLTPPLMGAVITAAGYWPAFAVAAAAATAAAAVVPARDAAPAPARSDGGDDAGGDDNDGGDGDGDAARAPARPAPAAGIAQRPSPGQQPS
ncbi:MFS transporter [Streptomyces sp. HB2AG]|uniref:MFS transporter n=1 Tax=Streptomyces sp. HB2AG TaxID=2983400 RepID=UPI0022A9FB44|nr:MFS transporter [Streptomyces sp. HB2AG]MCZ2526679.1 MFS transporter [Streptomyces sp. HB2AG]